MNDKREELAQDIRIVDGSHALGAGALAEALVERGWTRQGPITDEWEYAIRYLPPSPYATESPLLVSREGQDAIIASSSEPVEGVRRRKAGPWEPVEAAERAR